jgi:hypothetical protein
MSEIINSEPARIDGTMDLLFLLKILEAHKSAIQAITDGVPPSDVILVAAFLTAAVESQVETAGEAFDEVRVLFRQMYPELLKHAAGLSLDRNQIAIIVPTVEAVVVDEQKFPTSGSKLVN